MRYLAIDLGDKRTGLALGDSVTRLATPVRLVEVPIAVRGGDELLETLAAAVEELLGSGGQAASKLTGGPSGGRTGGSGWGQASVGGELVVGLPLNMDGTEGPRAKGVRAFADRLREKTGRPIHFADERLSTADADWSLAQSGLTHKQKKLRRDAVAAAGILQEFLNGLA